MLYRRVWAACIEACSLEAAHLKTTRPAHVLSGQTEGCPDLLLLPAQGYHQAAAYGTVPSDTFVRTMRAIPPGDLKDQELGLRVDRQELAIC